MKYMDEWEKAHPPAPARQSLQPRSKSGFEHAWKRFWWITFAVSTVIGLITQKTAWPVAAACLVVMFISFSLAVFPFVIRYGWRIGGKIGLEARAAATPIPSPAEIGWSLSQEWGRPATVEEVAAVQQMLHNRKNEAMVNTGVTFGALYLMNRNLHGR